MLHSSVIKKMSELGTLESFLSWGWECSTINDLMRECTQASWLLSSLQISYKRLLAVLRLPFLGYFYLFIYFTLFTVLELKFYSLLESCMQNSFHATLWHFWTKGESIKWLKCESLFGGLCYYYYHIVMKLWRVRAWR